MLYLLYKGAIDSDRLPVLAEFYCIWNGKVIGEFVCDNVDVLFDTNGNPENYMTDVLPSILQNTALSYDEFAAYVGSRADKNSIYRWHISDLRIYDKPKELSEFYKYCGDDPDCNGCEARYYSNTECGLEDYCCSKIDGCRPINRPPQSWCYVDEPLMDM